MNLQLVNMSTINKTIRQVPYGNVNAEKDERLIADFLNDGIPETYTVKGNKHKDGGVNLNIPEGSFFFSDYKGGKSPIDGKDMRIKDPFLLRRFGMKEKKSGYTPAEIASKYDVSKFKEILLDPDSTKQEKETAQLIIENYMQKLGELALIQESMKGFDNGIPLVAMPYLEKNGISPEELFNQEEVNQQPIQNVVLPSEVNMPQAVAQAGGETQTYTKNLIPSDRTKHKVFESQEDAQNWLEGDASKDGVELIWIKTGDDAYRPYTFNQIPQKEYSSDELDYMSERIGEEQFNEIGALKDYLSSNNFDKARKIYNIWRNRKDKSKTYKDSKYVESDANLDKDWFEKNYKEQGYDSPEHMFADMILDDYSSAIQYRNKHKDDWEEWSTKPDENSYTKKVHLNTKEHTKQFMDEMGWNENDIAVYQSIQNAINDFAKTEEGKKDGLNTDSYNKRDPKSQAGYGTTTKGSDLDTSYVDSLFGERTADWRVYVKNHPYELVDAEYTPEQPQSQKIAYDPLTIPPKRPMPINLPEHLKQINAFNDIFGVRGYYPWEAPVADNQLTPHYLNNMYEINNLNSLGASMAENMQLDADPIMNRLNASAISSQIGDKIMESDANKYNENIDIANQVEEKNAMLRQDNNKLRYESATKLHDNYQKVNQQLANTRRALKKNYVDSIANTLNKSVDLYTRGTNDFYFDQLGAITYEPHYWEKVNPQAAVLKAQEYIDDRAKTLIQRGVTPDKAYEEAQKEYKLQTGQVDNPYESILRSQGIIS